MDSTDINLSNSSTTIVTIEARYGFLYDNKKFADIHFIVGKKNQQRRIPAHQLILSVASTVFETMFFGSLKTKSNEIEIPDVEPASFMQLLKFVYSNEVEINAEIVINTLYAARKYDLPGLEKHCVDFLKNNLTSDNAFVLLTQARLYNESDLITRCLDKIDENTTDTLDAVGFTEIDLDTLICVLKRDTLQVFESKLFQAILLWSEAECARKQLLVSVENQRSVLGQALTLIRYSLMTLKIFQNGPIQSGLLDESYVKQIYIQIATNAYLSERPRCSKTSLECQFKFYSEAGQISKYTPYKSYCKFKQPVFIVGFTILNIVKDKSKVELAFINQITTKEERVIVTYQCNDLSPSLNDRFPIKFNRPIRVNPNEYYNINIEIEELADATLSWRPESDGVIEQRGQRIKRYSDYLEWKSYSYNVISEIIFFE